MNLLYVVGITIVCALMVVLSGIVLVTALRIKKQLGEIRNGPKNRRIRGL